jgi:hypothetical protein
VALRDRRAEEPRVVAAERKALVTRKVERRAAEALLAGDRPEPRGPLAAACRVQQQGARVANRGAAQRQTAPERQAAAERLDPVGSHRQAAQQLAVLRVVEQAQAVLRAAVHPRAALAAKAVELLAVAAVVGR